MGLKAKGFLNTELIDYLELFVMENLRSIPINYLLNYCEILNELG